MRVNGQKQKYIGQKARSTKALRTLPPIARPLGLNISKSQFNIGVDTIGPGTDVTIEKTPNKWLLSGQNR